MGTAGRSIPDEAIWGMSVQALEENMRHLMPLLAAAASVLSTAPVYADLGDELFKLLADDGAAGDRFGRSVARGQSWTADGQHCAASTWTEV